MKEPNSLEADLNKAIEQSISSQPRPVDASFMHAQPPGEELPAWYNKKPPANGSRKAVDQLAQARDGLLKVEQELDQLLMTIAGAPEADKPSPARDRPEPPEGLPMFDRVRQDATTLAELAIRMHTRIQHALERL